MTSSDALLPVQTLREEEGSSKTTRRGWRMPSFRGGKSPGAFGQSAFFLAGNRMTTAALKLRSFSKTIQFDRSEAVRT